jgi:hypothetical protein
MKLKNILRKRRHKRYLSNFILTLEFECDALRKQIKSVNDKTLIRKMIFKTNLQKKYGKRLQLLEF